MRFSSFTLATTVILPSHRRLLRRWGADAAPRELRGAARK